MPGKIEKKVSTVIVESKKRGQKRFQFIESFNVPYDIIALQDYKETVLKDFSIVSDDEINNFINTGSYPAWKEVKEDVSKPELSSVPRVINELICRWIKNKPQTGITNIKLIQDKSKLSEVGNTISVDYSTITNYQDVLKGEKPILSNPKRKEIRFQIKGESSIFNEYYIPTKDEAEVPIKNDDQPETVVSE